MNATQPKPFTWTTTTPLMPGWHRLAALVARHDITQDLRRIGEVIAHSGVLTGRPLDIAVTWYTHEGTDRGHLAPTVRTVRTVRAALTAAGIDLTGASITHRHAPPPRQYAPARPPSHTPS